MANSLKAFNLPFNSLADVEKFEQTPIEQWVPYHSVYDAFCATVA